MRKGNPTRMPAKKHGRFRPCFPKENAATRIAAFRAHAQRSTATQSAIRHCTFNAVSSIRNEVCNEASSVPVNFTTTVFPM